jgi:Tol biopolymer transport system component
MMDGGPPAQLTQKASLRPAVSPDGKLIACWYWEEKPDIRPQLAIVPMAGGPPIKFLDMSPTVIIDDVHGPSWTPDGRALTYVDTRNGADNIWRHPLDGGKPAPLTNFKSDRIESFNWSRDGKLAISRGLITTDVVLIRDTR